MLKDMHEQSDAPRDASKLSTLLTAVQFGERLFAILQDRQCGYMAALETGSIERGGSV